MRTRRRDQILGCVLNVASEFQDVYLAPGHQAKDAAQGSDEECKSHADSEPNASHSTSYESKVPNSGVTCMQSIVGAKESVATQPATAQSVQIALPWTAVASESQERYTSPAKQT